MGGTELCTASWGSVPWERRAESSREQQGKLAQLQDPLMWQCQQLLYSQELFFLGLAKALGHSPQAT